jgi:peptidoglycan/LPS O-acetylase OafA/YrhL
MPGSERGERFVKDVEGLRLRDPSSGRAALWLRVSVGLMVASVVVAVVAFFMSHSTTDPLTQRDAIVLASGAVVLAVVGGAAYVRFALSRVLMFWLARQSFDLSAQTEALAERLGGAQASDDATPGGA